MCIKIVIGGNSNIIYADQMLIMGVFDQEGASPSAGDYSTPMDRINLSYRTSGVNDSEPFATSRSNGVDVTVGTGRYLYLLFAAPNPNTLSSEQTITITIEVIAS